MRTRFAVAMFCAVAVAGCTYLRAAAERVGTATVNFSDATGASKGSALLWQDLDGIVQIDLRLVGLPPGLHGIHFHAVGRCDNSGDAAFSSAGAHFNPGARQHGLNSPNGPHAGDLPNVEVRSNGTAEAAIRTDRVTLTESARSVFDADGTALAIHAMADDQITDPSGSSGARIACGVVAR